MVLMARLALIGTIAVNLVRASGVAWARVEAGRHFPSDVLAGAALGNFITTFILDAFLSPSEDSSLGFSSNLRRAA